MTTIGIIANPASGQDIRRLIAAASVIGNDEKVRIVRRLLAGIAATGVDRVRIMPDSYGIGVRALDGLDLPLDAAVLDMPAHFAASDSEEATLRLVAEGATCLVTLGGDGTNRMVARACGEVPLVPLSTGTNNVFPVSIDATTAGIAAGLAAKGLAEQTIHRSPRLDIFVSGPPADAESPAEDLALVDASACADPYIGARAVWDSSLLSAVALARIVPGCIGLASIGAHLPGGAPPPDHGLFIRVGEGGRPVFVPIAPGLIQAVSVVSARLLPPLVAVEVRHDAAWVLVVDGERDRELQPGQPIWIRYNPVGPRVVDVRQAIARAAAVGHFIGTG